MSRQAKGDRFPALLGKIFLPGFPTPRTVPHAVQHQDRCLVFAFLRRVDDAFNAIVDDVLDGVGFVLMCFVEADARSTQLVLVFGKRADGIGFQQVNPDETQEKDYVCDEDVENNHRIYFTQPASKKKSTK